MKGIINKTIQHDNYKKTQLPNITVHSKIFARVLIIEIITSRSMEVLHEEFMKGIINKTIQHDNYKKNAVAKHYCTFKNFREGFIFTKLRMSEIS